MKKLILFIKIMIQLNRDIKKTKKIINELEFHKESIREIYNQFQYFLCVQIKSKYRKELLERIESYSTIPYPAGAWFFNNKERLEALDEVQEEYENYLTALMINKKEVIKWYKENFYK